MNDLVLAQWALTRSHEHCPMNICAGGVGEGVQGAL